MCNMVKNEPVSLKRQTLYCLIPFLDIYAAYRVQCIRKYFLIILLIGLVVGFVDTTLFPENNWQDWDDFVNSFLFLNYVYDPIGSIPYIIQHIGFVLLAIYLIRHWSNNWNRNFEKTS